MTTFLLPIDHSAGVPLHSQIYQKLRRAILDGLLRPGQRVPSSRGLAQDLEVSRQPVLTAYEQLLHEGYLVGRIGSGTFVSRALPDDLLKSAMPPSKAACTAVAQSRSRALVSDDSGLGPFRISLPALDAFPSALWARLLARHARALTPAQMAYGDPAGVIALRVAVAEHLRTARGVNCEAEQVVIVSGSQAALRLATTVLLERGDRVAMEEPGYPGARAAFAAGGARLGFVPVDEEGMNVAALVKLRGRVRAAYVTPSHQYPLGTTMSAARRLALLDWAYQADAWVLEDDYDSEYRYVSRPLGALQGLDTRERVIYIGTFSKVLFPAVRVAYLVVPPALRHQFVEARRAFDLFSPTLYQLTLAEFLRDGHFARHLRRMRGIYLRRRNALLAGLDRYCADRMRVYNADAGLHVAVLLQGRHDDTEVVRRMASKGLRATALSTCYGAAGGRAGLLLGFGGTDEHRLRHATRVLGELLTRGERNDAIPESLVLIDSPNKTIMS